MCLGSLPERQVSVARHVVVQTRGDMDDQNLIVYNIDEMFSKELSEADRGRLKHFSSASLALAIRRRTTVVNL